MQFIRRMIEGPTPAEILARDLAAAERDLIEAESQREYYSAMQTMLAGRVQRLRAALRHRANQEGST